MNAAELLEQLVLHGVTTEAVSLPRVVRAVSVNQIEVVVAAEAPSAICGRGGGSGLGPVAWRSEACRRIRTEHCQP